MSIKYIMMISSLLFFLGCSSGPVDGKAIFESVCSNCHGKFARKSAFGKSQVIANWSKEEIKHALIGYQEGTYGRSMKGLMRSEVKYMSNDEIEAVAEHIFSLSH